jgi:hypothetical protein
VPAFILAQPVQDPIGETASSSLGQTLISQNDILYLFWAGAAAPDGGNVYALSCQFTGTPNFTEWNDYTKWSVPGPLGGQAGVSDIFIPASPGSQYNLLRTPFAPACASAPDGTISLVWALSQDRSRGRYSRPGYLGRDPSRSLHSPPDAHARPIEQNCQGCAYEE